MQYPSFLRKLNPLCFTFPKKQYILSCSNIFSLRGKSREISFNIFFDVSATFSECRVHSFYEVSKRASRQQVVTISKSAPPARDVKGHAVDLTRSFGIGREKEHSPRHAEKEKEEKREKEREKRKEPASRRRFLYRRLDTLLSSGREAKQNKGCTRALPIAASSLSSRGRAVASPLKFSLLFHLSPAPFPRPSLLVLAPSRCRAARFVSSDSF